MKKFAIFFTTLICLFYVQGCSVRPAVTKRAAAIPKVKTVYSGKIKSNAFQRLQKLENKTYSTSDSVFTDLSKKYNLVSVPTYDGSGQETHPKILYFSKGWNGWKYWMSFTPYPNGNDDYENPSIVVSNDMTNWQEPKESENPISGVPYDVRFGGHYSDPHIVMRNNIMELWYRYNHGNTKTDWTDYSIDYYYRKTSTDGVHWSEPELMEDSKGGILSLDVNYSGSKYEFWYTDYKHRLLHSDSVTGTNWANTSVCSLELPKNYAPWHQDIIQYKGEYYLLQTGINLSKYSFSLFLSHSTDGIHFTDGVPFYPSNNPLIRSQAWLYRSTLFEDNNKFSMMVSVRFPSGQWYMMKSEIPVSEFFDTNVQTSQSILPLSKK